MEKTRILLLILGLPLFGCATSQTPKYSDRQIDRPYTLSKDLSTWETILGGSTDQDQARIDPSSRAHFSFYPFFWRHGLSDTVTLKWFPFPLDLDWQIEKTDAWLWGLSVSFLGPATTGRTDFVWKPSLNSLFRFYVLKDYAFETDLSIQPELSRTEPKFAWTLGLRLGFLFQWTDAWFVKFRVHLLTEKNNPGGNYLGSKPVASSDQLFVRVPLSLLFSYRITEPWEVSGEYMNQSLGYQNDYQAHTFLLLLTHYW